MNKNKAQGQRIEAAADVNPPKIQVQMNLDDIVAELSQEIANHVKEKAILRAQLVAVSKQLQQYLPKAENK